MSALLILLDKHDPARHDLPPDLDVYVSRDYRNQLSQASEPSRPLTAYSHYTYSSVAIHAEQPRWPAAHLWRGNVHTVATRLASERLPLQGRKGL